MNLLNHFILLITSAFCCQVYANDLSPAAASSSSISSALSPTAVPSEKRRPTGAVQNVQALFQHASQLAQEGRDDEALDAFQSLIAQYPELPELYNNLATLYAKKGQYAQARAALESAISANPNYSLVYQNLGTVYVQLAILAYQQAAARDKQNVLSKQRQQDLQNLLRKNQIEPAKPFDASPQS